MANKASSNVGLVDKSIASLSGSSQLLMAENETRGALYIMNVGSSNIGIAFAPIGSTATAAIGSSGTYTLVPNGSLTAGDGGFVPVNAIYVIGTAGQPVTASETVNA
jgi:hypothetical protein